MDKNRRLSLSSTFSKGTSASSSRNRSRMTEFSLPRDDDAPPEDPKEVLYKNLMEDPVTRAMVLQLITSERANNEEYKREEARMLTNTPAKKVKRQYVCESPVALLRRRAREQRGETPSSDLMVTPSPTVPYEKLMDGVVAFVDVKSKNEDRSAGVRAVMRSMGAEVKSYFSSDVTHVVFKDGSFRTYEKAKILRKHLVSVVWVEMTRVNGVRASEKQYPALGTDSFNQNASKFCEQLERDYKEMVDDELSKTVQPINAFQPRKTGLPSEFRALQKKVSERPEPEDDFIPSSQDMEVGDIMLKKRPPSTTDSCLLPDSDSDSCCGVINGHSLSRSKSRSVLASDEEPTVLKEPPSDDMEGGFGSSSVSTSTRYKETGNKSTKKKARRKLQEAESGSDLSDDERKSKSPNKKSKPSVTVLEDYVIVESDASGNSACDKENVQSGVGKVDDGKVVEKRKESIESTASEELGTYVTKRRTLRSLADDNFKQPQLRNSLENIPLKPRLSDTSTVKDSESQKKTSIGSEFSLQLPESVKQNSVGSSNDMPSLRISVGSEQGSNKAPPRKSDELSTMQVSSASSKDVSSKTSFSPLSSNNNSALVDIIRTLESQEEDQQTAKAASTKGKVGRPKKTRRMTLGAKRFEDETDSDEGGRLGSGSSNVSLSTRKSTRLLLKTESRSPSLTVLESNKTAEVEEPKNKEVLVGQSEAVNAKHGGKEVEEKAIASQVEVNNEISETNKVAKGSSQSDEKKKGGKNFSFPKPDQFVTRRKVASKTPVRRSTRRTALHLETTTPNKSPKADPKPSTSGTSSDSSGGRRRVRRLYNPDAEIDEEVKKAILKDVAEAESTNTRKQDAKERTPKAAPPLPSIIFTETAKKAMEVASESTEDESLLVPIKPAKPPPKKRRPAKKVNPDLDEQKDLLVELLDRKVRRTPAKTEERPIKPQVRRSTMDFLPATPTPKKSQRAKGRRDTIVCTRFKKPDVMTFQQIVKKLGRFETENEVSKRTTHLVVAECSRTINLLRAIARGIWVLKSEWLYSSLENGKWLPEEDYELTQFSPAVQQCRIQHETFGPAYSMDIFEDCGPIYVTKSTHPRSSDLEELITLCKGKLVTSAKNAAIVVGEYLRFPEVTCVSELWVLDSITQNKCKSFERYLLEPPVPVSRKSDHF